MKILASNRKSGIRAALLGGVVAAGLVLSPAGGWNPVEAAATQKAENVGMPNPMVPYDSVLDAAKAAGFRPLYLPEISGYHLESVYVISGKTIDLRYAKDGVPEMKLTLRTAKAEKQNKSVAEKAKRSAEPTPNISGIYSVTWSKEKMDNVTVRTAKVPSIDKSTGRDGFVAAWWAGGRLFSAYYENIDKPEFEHQLKDALLPLSQNYFRSIKKR